MLPIQGFGISLKILYCIHQLRNWNLILQIERMIIVENNFYDAQIEMINGYEVNEDHYNGKNSIFRLAASYNKFFKPSSISKEIDKTVRVLIKILENSSVIPSNIFLDFAGGITIDWYSNFNQVVTSIEQYTVLINEFISFIESLGIEGLAFQSGCLIDDPNEIDIDSPININPKFTSYCFGNGDGAIEVIDCRLIKTF